MTRSPILLTVQTAAAAAIVASASAAPPAPVDPVASLQAHCLGCHGEDDKVKGKVDLRDISTAEQLAERTGLLSSIVDVLDFHEMPPEGEPPIPAEERARLLAGLRAMLDRALDEQKAYPATPIRRMNRFQYNNAVVDLFELSGSVYSLPERMMREHKGYFRPEVGAMAQTVTVGNRPLGKSQMIEPRLAGVAAFPQDLRAEHGYDNQADHLSLSPLLMEQFLKLAQSIVESPDFNRKRVGVWDALFAEPQAGGDVRAEVRARLERFLTRAFRRPVGGETLDRYATYVDGQLGAGTGFPDAMKAAAAAAISSPRFLYLYDKAPPEPPEGAAPELDPYDIATRLSLFLWGSIPDEELLAAAAGGELGSDQGLSTQFGRMLKDKKLKRFCDRFPTQWLQLERIVSALPDPVKFPGFYYSKYRDSMHMAMEPLLLFETVLIEDLPITQLIDSDFTYRSGLLQDAYGELAADQPPGLKRNKGEVTVLTFDRLPVTDRRSGGVITNAAVMTMTSGPERTQPITRGAWIAGVIFNNPPEPPPADVPPLGEKPAQGEEDLTLRERLSAHRERADCRGCHDKIDPLGFALENYGPVGNWRERYENEREVDPSGKLFRQHGFADIAGFKDALLAEKDRFTRALAGHLLAYALARELSPADQPALDQIAAATAAEGYRLQTLLRQVALSEPFRTKGGPGATEVSAAPDPRRE